jgi:hypothetical protein
MKRIFKWLDSLTPRQQLLFLFVYAVCCFELVIVFTAFGKTWP